MFWFAVCFYFGGGCFWLLHLYSVCALLCWLFCDLFGGCADLLRPWGLVVLVLFVAYLGGWFGFVLRC